MICCINKTVSISSDPFGPLLDRLLDPLVNGISLFAVLLPRRRMCGKYAAIENRETIGFWA